MAHALDTNCILRWLLWDVPEQAQKVENALNRRPNVQIADVAIAETVWVLKSVFEFDDMLIGKMVEKLITHENINCNRVLFNRVLEDFVKSPKASFVDMCLAHYAGLQDAKLLTFDKTLAKKLPKLVQLA